VHEKVRKWIVEILVNNPSPVSIALRQRAKFEGWLKFELAALAKEKGASEVEVEASSSKSGNVHNRSDIAFRWNDIAYDIELKTPNMNWRMPGVVNKTRPVTKNIDGIIRDARKLEASESAGLVAFVMFPIPCGDHRWCKYLERIGEKLAISLSPALYTSQITLPVSECHDVDVVSCCFPVSTK